MRTACTLTVAICVFCALTAAILQAAPANRVAAVENGVLRWQDDHSEVALFGVNYYPPFSIDYDLIKARGLSHEQAIRDDVTHFERLGLSAIRLHCWDREMSDHEGNLIDNEHLQLLDYLINECQRRGIYAVMTPIAWWQTAHGGGFSDIYPMAEMISGEKARAAQCNYLKQYMNHVNRYTGKAYKDDPAIVAIELINEPIPAPNTPDSVVTEYVNTLCAAVRSTGSKKPIFFNCWGPRVEAAAASTLDGVTFGWYPTGLAGGQMLTSNYLPAVQDYPSMRDPKLAKLAKIVYEFDAADVHKTYMYPSMARAFRRGGAQSATQFQYDPMCIAEGNANWQTHFLNLCYAPGKALSFAIAAEVMRRTPRLSQETIPGLKISFEEDLSELCTGNTFMYTNNTATKPQAAEKLARIAGRFSSPVVQYGGTGAYFLDKMSPGVWKLQVYPDAVMVADPYMGGANEKMRIIWGNWPLTVKLPDLGGDFRAVTTGAIRHPERLAEQEIISAQAGQVKLKPGEYLLVAAGKPIPTTVPGVDFIAPPSSSAPPTAFVRASRSWREGKAFPVRATVPAKAGAEVALHVRPAGASKFDVIPMAAEHPYEYAASVPAAAVKAGALAYYVSVKTEGKSYVYPAGADIEAETVAMPPYTLATIKADDPLPKVSGGVPEGKTATAAHAAGREPNTTALRLEATGFGAPPSCMGAEVKLAAVPANLDRYTTVTAVVRGGPDTMGVEMALVQKDGTGFGTVIPLSTEWNEVSVPLANLRPMWGTQALAPDFKQLDRVSLIFGSWLFPDAADRKHTVEFQSLELRRAPDLSQVEVTPQGGPVVLVEPGVRQGRPQGHDALAVPVAGMDRGKQGLRVSVGGFNPGGDCTSMRFSASEEAALCKKELAAATTLIVKARAGQPATRQVELVLIEADGTPWGTEVQLTREWKEIRIPILTGLRHFKHWNVGPPERGGPGDHLNPDKVEAVSLCFGTWLQPDNFAQPQGIEIQDVALGE